MFLIVICCAGIYEVHFWYMAILVDTHKIYSLLTKAGFEKEKATALVEAFSTSAEELATKEDLENLRNDLKKEMLLHKKDMVIHQWIVGTAVVAFLSAIKFLG